LREKTYGAFQKPRQDNRVKTEGPGRKMIGEKTSPNTEKSTAHYDKKDLCERLCVSKKIKKFVSASYEKK